MTKFKVGDRVEFIDGSYRLSLVGKKGTVYSVSSYTPNQDLVRVRFDNEPRAEEGFFDHRLKKIEADIAVGDKVIIDFLGHTRHNHVGVLQSEFGSNGYIVTFGDVAGYYFDKKVIKRWLPPEASALQNARSAEIAEKARAEAQQFMYGQVAKGMAQKVERTIAEAAHSGAPAGLVAEASASAKRKATPVTTGVLDYFPDAIKAIARLSKNGNDKHNPGEPLHWSRGKSNDHRDCIGRHLIDCKLGEIDPDTGELHDTELAWRALANLQLAEEKRLGKVAK